MTTGLFCFTHDLRLQDNPALSKASMSVDKLICSYNFTPAWCQHSRSVSLKLGDKRQAFLDQSVADLANSLTELGQKLIITKGDPFISISELIERYQPSDVFYSEQIAFFERATWQALACAYPQCQFHLLSSYTLFDENQLPFMISDLPNSFHRFRELCEKQQPLQAMRTIDSLPAPPATHRSNTVFSTEIKQRNGQFEGGEHAAVTHLHSFF